MKSEWVRDNKRRLLFLKRTVNGRTRVYGKGEGDSHYGFEGSVDPNEKFIRRPNGERIGRGNHPDLIHAEAQKRRQASVTPTFTDSHDIHRSVNVPVSRTESRTSDGNGAEAIGGLIYGLGMLTVMLFSGLTGFGAFLTVMFVVLGIFGFCAPAGGGVCLLVAIAGIVFARIYESKPKESD